MNVAPLGAGRHSRRLVATSVLGALALVLSACGSADHGSPRASTADRYDAAPVEAGSAWLSSQVTHGVVHNDQYDLDDYGLAVDVALALEAVDAQTGTVTAISRRLAAHLDEYTSPGYGTVTSAGSTAKATVLAEATGADPSAFGGTDLVEQLAELVSDEGRLRGRLQDRTDPQDRKATDYANVVGQAYAVMGLGQADDARTAAATDFLLAQQCKQGWFRLTFTADLGAGQSCEADPTSRPDIDATATAVRALATRTEEDPTVADHVASAVAWLESVQTDDGSLGEGTGTVANSNSTGLAGWAFGVVGETAAAERAATWVFQHQARAGTACGDFHRVDLGAVAYDDDSLSTAARRGITVKTADQFRRASAQALPALQWLPATVGDEAGDRKGGAC
jgi:hypothetical protein